VINVQKARINTAGAYICLDGYYLFAIGIQPHSGHIPVVRLGGHRQEDETGWQCAAREVYEEANLHIQPLLPQTTYVCDWEHSDRELECFQWPAKAEQEPIPFLVVIYCDETKSHLSLMYLAEAEGVPTPSSEVKGLLLLTPGEIHYLCQETVTLEQYLHRGGRAILNANFDLSLVLEPFAQLRLLSRILMKVPPRA
jgi:ADP-ribose pyrophosphatase YjhB (NUDIX family)